MILAAIFFGWLPGIGGIPLFLGGLGLLAINNEWARKWLEYLKNRGSDVARVVFAENKKLMFMNDIIAALLFSGSVIVLVEYPNYFARTIAFAGMGLSAGLFFGNRDRLKRIIQIYRKYRPKNPKTPKN